MDETGLAAFVALAEELNFTRAAACVHVTQPALTKQIQRLEAELGIQLFARTKRAVRLTTDGEWVLGQARQALAALNQVALSAEQLRRGAAGTLRIGFTPTAPQYVVPPLMRRFRELRPDVVCSLVELSTEDQIAGLLDGSLDVGILRNRRAPGLIFHVVLQEPYIAVLPREHRLASRQSVRLQDLAKDDLLMVTKTEDPVLASFRAVGVQPANIRYASQMHAVTALVASGCGVSVMPLSARHVRLPDVVYRPLRNSTLTASMALAMPRTSPNRSAREFVRIGCEMADSTMRFGYQTRL